MVSLNWQKWKMEQLVVLGWSEVYRGCVLSIRVQHSCSTFWGLSNWKIKTLPIFPLIGTGADVQRLKSLKSGQHADSSNSLPQLSLTAIYSRSLSNYRTTIDTKKHKHRWGPTRAFAQTQDSSRSQSVPAWVDVDGEVMTKLPSRNH